MRASAQSTSDFVVASSDSSNGKQALGLPLQGVMATVEEALAQLRDPDPQKRGEAVCWLGRCGDARARAALEDAVLFDGGTWDDGRDGDSVGSTALRAIFDLRYFKLTEADYARIAERIVRSPELGPIERKRLERIVVQYGQAFRHVVKALTTHEHPMVRRLAWAILRKIDPPLSRDAKSPAFDADASDDEEIRFAVWRAWWGGMTIERLVKRYRAEPSARVRRRMASLWVKHYSVSPGSFDEALAFLSDSDPSVRIVVAGHILKRSHPWVGDERDNDALIELAREIIHGPRSPVPPTTPPTKTMAEGPAASENHFLSELLEKRRCELAELEREAVASGKERFDPDVFRKLGDFGDGTDAHYRWGYYLKPEYTRMKQYAAFLNEIAPWKDTR